MDERANAEALLGTSPRRRLLIFSLAPLAIDALLYGVCMLSGFDPLSAALVAKSALILALFAGLAGGIVAFSAQGRSAPAPWWEVAMRVLLAAAFIGLVGIVLGTGFLTAVAFAVSARLGAALIATALAITFVIGALAYVRGFAARAFALGGWYALPAALGQGIVLAMIGFAASPATDAVIAACTAGALLMPFLLFSARPPNGAE